MNKLTLLNLKDIKTTETWNFLDCKIKIIDDVEYNYTDGSEGYSLENAYFYSKNETMQETLINFSARVEYEVDYEFKRFINRQEARFELDFRINDKDCAVFCKKGNQRATINSHEWKEYDFTFKTVTRPFEKLSFQTQPIPPEHFPGSEYDIGKYDEARYSTDGASNLTLKAQFNGFMADTNSYFTISGSTRGEDIEIYVNGQVINISNNSSGFPFFYSNIPGDITIQINEEERYDLLNTANITNFLFDLRQIDNIVEVTGLNDAEIIIYKGLNIL